MKKFTLTFFLLLNSYILTWGQVDDFVNNIVPPSPEASAFGKYLDIPVNLSTGTPQIDIPITNLSKGGINVPISLSYHAGGVKVEELATQVGIGWSLNAGGMISRTIRGLPDESVRGYFSSYSPFVHTPGIGHGEVDPPVCTSPVTLNQANYLDEYLNGCYDGEPDKFFVSVPGFSGKFLFDIDAKLHWLPYQSVQLEVPPFQTNPFAKQWKLTLNDGSQYIFGEFDNESATEITRSYSYTGSGNINSCASFDAAPSTWYLLKIISPSRKDTVSFHYQDYETSHTSYTGEKRNLYVEGPGGNSLPYQEARGHQSIHINSKILSSITTSWGQEVKFKYDSQARLDLDGGLRLEEIELHNKFHLIKRFKLYHSYFYAGNAYGGKYKSNFNTKDNYRLKLDSLQELNAVGQALPPHKFEYIGGDFLPHRHEKCRDHWGYFNDVDNLTLLPTIVYPPSAEQPYDVIGGNRDCNPTACQIGTLYKITYPTGGSTEMTYEAHEIESPAYKFPKEHVNFEMDYDSQNPIKEQSFTLNTTRYIHYDADLPTDITQNYYCYLKLYKDGNFLTSFLSGSNIKRMKLDAGNYKIRAKMLNYDCGYSGSGGSAPCGLIDEVMEDAPSGPLPISDSFNGEKITLDIWWEKREDTLYLNTEYIGGCRIKKMHTFSEETSSSDIIKLFDYKYDSNHKFSGQLLNRIEYAYEIYANEGQAYIMANGQPLLDYNYCQNSPTDTHAPFNSRYIVISAESNLPQEAVQGSHIIYEEVITKQNKDSQDLVPEPLGKTVYTYSVVPGYAALFYSMAYRAEPLSFPLVPFRNDKTYNYGKLLKQVDYRYQKSDDTYHPIKEVISTYDTISPNLDFPIYGFKFGKRVRTACKNCTTVHGVGNTYAWQSYNQSPEDWLILKSSTEKVYDKFGQVMESQTIYHYDDYYQVKSQYMIDSKGEQWNTKFKYPYDYASGTNPALDEMINRHIISLPIEEQVWHTKSRFDPVNNIDIVYTNLISGKLTEFEYLSTEDLLVPQKIYLPESVEPIELSSFTEAKDGDDLYTSLIPNSYYKLRYEYLDYDNQGNLLSQAKRDDISSSYIWGYDKTRPIAQLVGATYTDIEQAFGGSVPNFNSDLGTDESTLRNWFSNNKPEVQITTYTYDESRGGVVSTVTSPNNQTVTYEYDEFHRLSHIKDFEGNILKSYQYHYKGE